MKKLVSTLSYGGLALLLSVLSTGLVPQVAAYAATDLALETSEVTTEETLSTPEQPALEAVTTEETQPVTFEAAPSLSESRQENKPQRCLASSELEWQYTYTRGSGTITVKKKDAKNHQGYETDHTDRLCQPLYVLSVAWNYNPDASASGNGPAWGQTRVTGDSILTIDSLGSYRYASPNTSCGQVDTYASWKKSDLERLGTILNGPDDPYEPPFLHEILKGKGTSPTYTHDNARCIPPRTPATPGISVTVEQCSEYNTTDDIIVTVTNTADLTKAPATYTVTVGTVSQTITLADGASGSLTFSGLPSGIYGVSLTGNDGTAATGIAVSTQVCLPPVITTCPEISQELITTVAGFADYQDTRSKGHYTFVDGGLLMYTDDNSSQSKVAWYHGVNYPLSAVGTPAIDYTSSFGLSPGMQLMVDFDNDGTIDGILVGEPGVYGNDWWLPDSGAQFVKDNAPSHLGGSGSANHGTLNQWLANFPNAAVKAVGFSLGSGVYASGTLHSLTFGCTTYVFDTEDTPVTPVVPSVPSTPQILAASTTLPSKLPATGASADHSIFFAFLAAIASYGAVYFLQGGRKANDL